MPKLIETGEHDDGSKADAQREEALSYSFIPGLEFMNNFTFQSLSIEFKDKLSFQLIIYVGGVSGIKNDQSPYFWLKKYF